MQELLTKSRWSPYFAGACIGVLSWIVFLFMGEALGTSTSVVTVAAMAEGLVAPEHVVATSYLADRVVGRPPVDWQMALDLLLPVGAFLAAWFAGGVRVRRIPDAWRKRFGTSVSRRYLGAFFGGAIMLFGARLAGGCTSGHCVSGGLQLAVSSLVFTAVLFPAGILTAMLMYRWSAGSGGDSNHV